jgi:hypothetical protein
MKEDLFDHRETLWQQKKDFKYKYEVALFTGQLKRYQKYVHAPFLKFYNCIDSVVKSNTKKGTPLI